MNAERLLRGLDLLADAPETVQQFRKLVVALAVAGKLGSRSEKTSDPSSLIKLVEDKKRALVKSGLLRKQNPSRTVTADDLPKGFASSEYFVQLGSVAQIEKGSTGIMKAQPGPFPLVVTAEERLFCDHFDFEGAAAIVPLVSSAGHGKASLQRLHYQEGKFALGSILAAIFPYAPELLSARFLFEYLTAFKDELLVSRMIGTANVSLSVGKVSEVPVPLVAPPVQRKVDELMALCDRLEAARKEREATRDRLTAASLARLNAPAANASVANADAGTTSSGTPEDSAAVCLPRSDEHRGGISRSPRSDEHRGGAFCDHARFVLDNLSALTTRPDQIKQLRQTILNLAVRGKLVPQDPNDKPASELLKRIAAENRKLLSEKNLRPQKPALPAENFEAQSEIPTAWQHVYLQDLAYQITDGTHLTPKYTEQGKPFLSAQNVKPFKFMPEKHRFVSDADFHNYRANRRPERGDVLMTRVGAGIGEAAVLDSDLEFAFYVSLCLIKIPTHLLSAAYLVLWLNSPEGRDSSTIRTYGKGASQGNLNLGLIRTFKIPLPPLAEQHRIVGKVDELMALCDRLEASLTTGDDTRRRLLNALLAEALTAEAPALASAQNAEEAA